MNVRLKDLCSINIKSFVFGIETHDNVFCAIYLNIVPGHNKIVYVCSSFHFNDSIKTRQTFLKCKQFIHTINKSFIVSHTALT